MRPNVGNACAKLRLIADLLTAVSVEEGAHRRERRRWFAEAMANFDPSVFPVIVGMFAGPEHVPDGADDGIVARVRRIGSPQFV